MLLVGRRAIAAPSGGMASAGLSMLTRATTKRHIVSQLDFMLRLLKVVLALGIPTIVVLVLIHSGLRNMSTASLAEWFTGYLIAIAAPQLVVIWVGTIRSFPTWAVIGALVALDTWLIFIAWSIFHSTDYAGASWLVYLVGSLPVAAAGALLGKAASSLTRRWS